MSVRIRRFGVVPAAAAVASACVAFPAFAQDAAPDLDLDASLRFEAGEEAGAPRGWRGGPAVTIHLDTTLVHTGNGAVRLERDASSPDNFSALTKILPVEFGGDSVELGGFLRTKGVEGFAGLWMRQDGGPGVVLQFDNMQDRGLRGTTDWTKYDVKLPLDPAARQLVFGVLVSGNGIVWADDLELRVDGRPLKDAPERLVERTILDTDREFDDGSGIDVSSLTDVQVENLVVLGRVWGFLKYHHPRITAGEFHWDYELFRILPAVLEADGLEARNRILSNWIEQTPGVPESCDPCAEGAEDVHLHPGLAWLDDTTTLGSELSRQLQTIHANRSAAHDRFFVRPGPGAGNPMFDRELGYPTQRPPDAGYRILALLRHWNAIEYWFPYRDLLEDDWPSVLRKFLPRFVEAEDWDAYRLELLALITHVHDSHARLQPAADVLPPGGTCFWPFHIRFVEGRATVTGLAGGAGDTPAEDRRGPDPPVDIEVGDVVTHVDGTPAESLVAEWAPYYSASNETMRRLGIARSLPRGVCGPGRLTIERGGASRTVELPRVAPDERRPIAHDRPGETFQLLSPEVAYLKLSDIRAADVADYMERAAGTRGLVIDIRNYPSEFVVFALGGQFVEEPTPFARFTVADPANPGAFVWTPPVTLTPREPGYRGKVAILVDESSISQSEYTSMALRASPRAVVVGSTTAGADGNISPIPLPGGMRTTISGIGVFYADRRPTQRIGIVPDIEASPTVAGIRDGRDEVLEAALRHILGPEAEDEEIRELARRP